MSRYHSYISTASKLIESYDGKAPFAFHIKNYFRSEKKHGSKDRNFISTVCYNYFRTGHLFRNLALSEALKRSWYVCRQEDPGFLDEEPELKQDIASPASEKLSKLGFSVRDLFPFYDEVSQKLNRDQFCLSILSQPDLFIRIRSGKEEQVLRKLDEEKISFKSEGGAAIRLPNKTSIDKRFYIDREVVIQDLNSQRVLDDAREESKNISKQVLSVWDCCAASGGKSILAVDSFVQRLSLAVSDIRNTILSNLQQRFETAGIPLELSFVMDLEKNADPEIGEFDMIICDAPCTGSGTWARTPEELFNFNSELVEDYCLRQRRIASNAIRSLMPGGLFCYITCSVFKKENEEVVEFLKNLDGIELIRQQYLEGYELKADTMFTALFRKMI